MTKSIKSDDYIGNILTNVSVTPTCSGGDKNYLPARTAATSFSVIRGIPDVHKVNGSPQYEVSADFYQERKVFSTRIYIPDKLCTAE